MKIYKISAVFLAALMASGNLLATPTGGKDEITPVLDRITVSTQKLKAAVPSAAIEPDEASLLEQLDAVLVSIVADLSQRPELLEIPGVTESLEALNRGLSRLRAYLSHSARSLERDLIQTEIYNFLPRFTGITDEERSAFASLQTDDSHEESVSSSSTSTTQIREADKKLLAEKFMIFFAAGGSNSALIPIAKKLNLFQYGFKPGRRSKAERKAAKSAAKKTTGINDSQLKKGLTGTLAVINELVTLIRLADHGRTPLSLGLSIEVFVPENLRNTAKQHGVNVNERGVADQEFDVITASEIVECKHTDNPAQYYGSIRRQNFFTQHIDQLEIINGDDKQIRALLKNKKVVFAYYPKTDKTLAENEKKLRTLKVSYYQIAEGIYCLSVDLSGLTRAQIQTRIHEVVELLENIGAENTRVSFGIDESQTLSPIAAAMQTSQLYAQFFSPSADGLRTPPVGSDDDTSEPPPTEQLLFSGTDDDDEDDFAPLLLESEESEDDSEDDSSEAEPTEGEPDSSTLSSTLAQLGSDAVQQAANAVFMVMSLHVVKTKSQNPNG